MKKKIILVGVGGFGKSWRYAISNTPDVEVVALVDPNTAALEEGASHFGVARENCFTDPQKPWEDVEADFVIDSTGHHLHLQNATRAFAGGKDYLVCKPMSDTWENGLRIVEECDKHGRKMVVAQQLRYHPLILKLREIVQSGVLGTIGYLHLDWLVPRTMRYIGIHRSWRQPYPLFVECSIHHLDYLRWVLGEDAVEGWGETWVAPWDDADLGAHQGYATYRMESGCMVCYRATRMSTAKRTSWLCEWNIEGEKGYLVVRDDKMYLNGEEQPLSWENGADISDLRLNHLNKVVMDEFLKYLDTGEEPPISGRNNLNSLHMCFAAIESSKTGRRITLYRRSDRQ